MVVNVDHTCPHCDNDGFCHYCNNSGVVRLPADLTPPDQHMVEQVRIKHGDEAAEEALEAYYGQTIDETAIDLSIEWMRTDEAKGVLPTFIDKEVAMEYAFEAGFRAGRASQ